MRKLKAFMVVSRWEYMPAAIDEVGIPVLLALNYVHFSIEFLLLILAGLIVWWGGHYIGSHINCLSDYEVDQMYKSYLSDAVDVIGKRNLKIIIAVEIILITLFVVFLTFFLGRSYLLLFWLVGVIFAFAYSIEPLRFKGRGLLNPFTLDIILYLCPMFFIYHLLCREFYYFSTVVILIFALLRYPEFFIDEIIDYEEDKIMGIKNPCALYGRFKVTLAATIIHVVASLSMVWWFVSAYPPQKVISYMLYGIALLCFIGIAGWFIRTVVDSYQFENYHQVEEKVVKRLKNKAITAISLVTTGIGVICLAITALV